MNWSGVENASSSQALQFAANPPRGIGFGAQGNLSSLVALPSGINEIDDLTINIFAYVVGLSASETLTIEAFAHWMTFSNNGWNSYSIGISRIEDFLSDEFGLSMYQVGVEQSELNAIALLSINNKIATSPYIQSLSIIGV